ncbi:hypothetical protein Bhyg_10451 [Pseudolycoriella hygida]|uniref:TIL domain-containing protein n=1 Tax=Pseudolycoriella hygida TaxID=35572 RepID=A0A9Q0MTI1_9DIPT|nr:hypothetical protein Bhyg_10451 [Pseudolycoriella hygida]
MKLTFICLLVAVAIASVCAQTCPPNEYYTECYHTDAECIPTCTNPDPQCQPTCSEDGPGQCVCVYGYVRHHSGACVQVAHC